MQKTKDALPKEPCVRATGPFLRIRVAGLGVIESVLTKKLIVALEETLERGVYPIFLANETTFSLKVALSIKTSFVTILALYEVM